MKAYSPESDSISLLDPQVCERAGFASLRRFNAVFAEVCRRTPSDIRRLVQKKRPG